MQHTTLTMDKLKKQVQGLLALVDRQNAGILYRNSKKLLEMLRVEDKQEEKGRQAAEKVVLRFDIQFGLLLSSGAVEFGKKWKELKERTKPKDKTQNKEKEKEKDEEEEEEEVEEFTCSKTDIVALAEYCKELFPNFIWNSKEGKQTQQAWLSLGLLETLQKGNFVLFQTRILDVLHSVCSSDGFKDHLLAVFFILGGFYRFLKAKGVKCSDIDNFILTLGQAWKDHQKTLKKRKPEKTSSVGKAAKAKAKHRKEKDVQ